MTPASVLVWNGRVERARPRPATNEKADTTGEASKQAVPAAFLARRSSKHEIHRNVGLRRLGQRR